MIKSKRFTALGTAMIILLCGCTGVSDEERKGNGKLPNENIPSLVPVADYTGEEYELRDADPDMEISAEMESEIETAVKDFFQENYKTEVKMNRYFHGDGYVRAVVESVDDPLFYTEVNVGLEKDGDLVTGVTSVGAREGEIEQAITSGLIAMVREEQFAELDELFEQFSQENPVQGVQPEVVTGVTGNRYATPYYFVAHGDEKVEGLLDVYLEEAPIDKADWQDRYSDLAYDPEMFTIAINLYMTDAEAEPDQSIIDRLVEKLRSTEMIPRGRYPISLHDSNIIGRMSVGEKENSLKFKGQDIVIKE